MSELKKILCGNAAKSSLFLFCRKALTDKMQKPANRQVFVLLLLWFVILLDKDYCSFSSNSYNHNIFIGNTKLVITNSPSFFPAIQQVIFIFKFQYKSNDIQS